MLLNHRPLTAAVPVVDHVHFADLVRVIDGDTFVARVELDFRVRVDITVRVRGLWAPELSTPEGLPAKEALETLFASFGNRMTLLSYKQTMSFSRWVCDVWVGDKHLTDEPVGGNR